MTDKHLNRFGLSTEPIVFEPLIGATIIQARLALGLDQPAMASSLGLSTRQYLKIENGQIMPSLRTRMALRWLLVSTPPRNRGKLTAMLQAILEPDPAIAAAIARVLDISGGGHPPSE